MRSLAGGLVLALVTAPGAEQVAPTDTSGNVTIHNGFLTGMAYRRLPEDKQRIYAAGIIDGMLMAPVFDAPKRDHFKPKEMAATTRIEWLEGCIEGMNDEQVAAIFNKWLRDHPERWHETAHTSVYSALLDSCPPQPTRKR